MQDSPSALRSQNPDPHRWPIIETLCSAPLISSPLPPLRPVSLPTSTTADHNRLSTAGRTTHDSFTRRRLISDGELCQWDTATRGQYSTVRHSSVQYICRTSFSRRTAVVVGHWSLPIFLAPYAVADTPDTLDCRSKFDLPEC